QSVDGVITTLDDGSCEQSTPSNDFENGLGNLHLLEFANDFVVNEGQSFSLESMTFSIMVEPGESVDSADLHFYQDSGNGPGAEISSLTGVEPTSVEDTGEAFDFDVKDFTFDLDDPIDFPG